MPSGQRHAFRNRGREPSVALIATTTRLARFFDETCVPAEAAAGLPGPERLQRFQAVAARYGHWNASPQENAAAGIELPPPR